MSCQYYHGIQTTKKLVNYSFLPLFLFCLLPKWGGAADANLAIPFGEEGVRAATLSFHSFCQVPCRVKYHRDTVRMPAKAYNFRSRELVWQRYSCASGILTVTGLLYDSTDQNSWGGWSLLSMYRWMYYLFFLVQKVCSMVEFKMLKCIYKSNASSSCKLEQFLLLKDSSGWSVIRENYSCKMSGIQIASFISKLLEEGHAHEKWKEIRKVKVLGKSVHLLPLP